VRDDQDGRRTASIGGRRPADGAAWVRSSPLPGPHRPLVWSHESQAIDHPRALPTPTFRCLPDGRGPGRGVVTASAGAAGPSVPPLVEASKGRHVRGMPSPPLATGVTRRRCGTPTLLGPRHSLVPNIQRRAGETSKVLMAWRIGDSGSFTALLPLIAGGSRGRSSEVWAARGVSRG